jgi:hypothetical protein
VFHGGDGQVKTDNRDAADIAWMLRRNEGESIPIPAKEDEAARDVIRCRGDLMENLKGMKQRLLKFLLRKGVNYETDRYWTGKYYKWLNGLRFEDGMEHLAFQYTRMLFKGKLKQTAVAAVARELAGFIWGVMKEAV